MKPREIGLVIAIVGPTASGKSQAAMEIAGRCNGEIICADSRTIYRGMDIGTAKPTAADQAQVRHHLLDVIEPNQVYSAAEFKQAAEAAIADIHRRGKLPLLVGGTGLYVHAVIYNYSFPAGPSSQRRRELEQLPLGELVARLQQLDPERAAEIDLKNPRRVIRAIETAGQPRIAPQALPHQVKLIGVNPPAAELGKRIARRTHAMLQQGLIEEVQALLRRFEPIIEPLSTVGYRETVAFLHEQLSEPQLEEQINLHTRQLAKRQMTWFKRNQDIRWVEEPARAVELAVAFAAGHQKAV